MSNQRSGTLDQIMATPQWRHFRNRMMVFSLPFILIGLLLKIWTPNSSLLLIIGMGTLAVILFLCAYEPVDSRFEKKEDENGNIEFLPRYKNLNSSTQSFFASHGFASFMHKLFYWSASICVIAILFLLNHWPGSDNLVIIGGGTLALVLVLKLAAYLSLRDAR